MCGFVAWAKRRGVIEEGALAAAVLSLRHRGPDRQRVLLVGATDALCSAPVPVGQVTTRGGVVGLGHARLSIIDLDHRSDQPLVSPDGRYAIVFNGELYNFRELKLELASLGWSFRTQGDAEVMLAALVTWGAQATRRFNGMWSFAFFDARDRVIMLSRDRYGEKPLYYLHDDEEFIAASECKALFSAVGESRRRVQPGFVAHFLKTGQWQAADAHASAYEGVRALPPGASAFYSWNKNELRIIRSNCLHEFLEPPEPLSGAVARDLADAVTVRLTSDVPVGVLVSGGVDSSAVAASVAEARPAAWYAGVTDTGQDLLHARILARALGVALVEVDVRPHPDSMLDTIESMTRLYELPVWLSGNSIAMFQMYRAMAADGIRVVLDGTGSDEIFGGYFSAFAVHVVSSLVAAGRRTEAASFTMSCWWHRHCDVRPLFQRLTGGGRKTPDLEAAQLAYIESGKLPHWLTMNDLNSMGHSIEARSPFLDYRLAKYVRLPLEMKFHRGFNKYLLRKSLPDRVPREIRWRRDKQGFRWRPGNVPAVLHADLVEAIKQSAFVQEHAPEAIAQLAQGPLPHPLRYYAVARFEAVLAERRTACGIRSPAAWS